MDFIKVIHPTTSLVAKHNTVFLRDLFKGEDKVVKTAAECTRAFPVCGLALGDKAAAICPSHAFETCLADGSKVFLSVSSGCTKYASCPMTNVIEDKVDAAAVVTQPEAEQGVSAPTPTESSADTKAAGADAVEEVPAPTTTEDKPVAEATADDAKAADANAVEEEEPAKAADANAVEEKEPSKAADPVAAEVPVDEAQKEAEVTSPAGTRSASGPALLLGMIAALSVVALFA
jgi:hypothetical protein